METRFMIHKWYSLMDDLSFKIEAVAQRCSVKGVLRNLAKFTEKHLCQSLFFNKVAGLRPARKRISHRCYLEHRTPPVAASVKSNYEIFNSIPGWQKTTAEYIFSQQSRSTQPAITCSKLTIETLEQNVKYVRS